MANITITLGGEVLPVPTSFREITEPNESNNTTLDGTLYTDFVNVKRTWEVNWAFLCKEDYDAIRAVFDSQYELEAFPLLVVPFYTVSTPVKMNISTKNIRWDGNQIADFTITLHEQYAIS